MTSCILAKTHLLTQGASGGQGVFFEKNTPWNPKKLLMKRSTKVFEDH